MTVDAEFKRLIDTFLDNPPSLVAVELDCAQAACFCPLFLGGCAIKVRTGCSVRELLCEQFHVDPDYVRTVISTVFLDASPVDDLQGAFIKHGATLALSGALPGLVGAAMRKDGPSWLRAAITYREKGPHPSPGEGFILLKLFNRIMTDLGPSFLQRRVHVQSRALATVFAKLPQGFWSPAQELRLDEKPISPEALRDFLRRQAAWVHFAPRSWTGAPPASE